MVFMLNIEIEQRMIGIDSKSLKKQLVILRRRIEIVRKQARWFRNEFLFAARGVSLLNFVRLGGHEDARAGSA